MNLDYESEKSKLKKKIIIFTVIAVAFTALFRITMDENVGFFSCLFIGIVMGLVFYIPGRLREHFKLGWLATIVISIVFLFLLLWLSDKIGYIAYIILLLPIGDMGYSVYKVISNKES